MSKSVELHKELIALGDSKEYDKLKDLVGKQSDAKLLKLLIDKFDLARIYSLWDGILKGIPSTEEGSVKKKKLIIGLLNHLAKIDAGIKQSQDLVFRIIVELPDLKDEYTLEIAEVCMTMLKAGNSKCVVWKDLLPDIVNSLSEKNELWVNSIKMTGAEYKDNLIKNICMIKWEVGSLSSLAYMFKSMKSSKDQLSLAIQKLSEHFLMLNPVDLPPLAFQLFSLASNTSQLFTPVIYLNKYMYRNYYKNRLSNQGQCSSNLNSIDYFDENELLEADSTILHHLIDCTGGKISEKDVSNSLRELNYLPELIISPFLIGALICLSDANRYPDFSRLSSYSILHSIKTIVERQQFETNASKNSMWCKELLSDTRSAVNMKMIFDIFIEDCRNGFDAIIPGMISLAFTLLKCEDSKINYMAQEFLMKFVKRWYLYGPGIVKALKEKLLINQDEPQYAECLTYLSIKTPNVLTQNRSYIEDIMDFFLMIPGDVALAKMPFIIQLMKDNVFINNYFIKTMTTAILSKRQEGTRQMGVYGICLVLRALRYSTSRKGITNSQSTLSQSSGSISSVFSLSAMTQVAFRNTDNQFVGFDITALELLEILQPCLKEDMKVKEFLYEGLYRAVITNHHLAPHIIQFLESELMSYLSVFGESFELKLEATIYQNENNDVWEEFDNVGKILKTITAAIYAYKAEKLSSIDISLIEEGIMITISKIHTFELSTIGVTTTIDRKSLLLVYQYLNILESLIMYCIWLQPSGFEEHILKLYNQHSVCVDQVKPLVSSKKNTVKSTFSAHIQFKPVNNWDLITIEKLLLVILKNGSTADSVHEEILKRNPDLLFYVLSVTKSVIGSMESEPKYRQIKYSKTSYDNLIAVVRLLYSCSITEIEKICDEFDLKTGQMIAECFLESLRMADTLYNRKFFDFIQNILYPKETENGKECLMKLIQVIHDLIGKEFLKTNETQPETANTKIIVVLFHCLELLYKYLPSEEPETLMVYKWMYSLCCDYKMDANEYGIVFKLLFHLRKKIDISGDFYNIIAKQILQVIGLLEVNDEDTNLSNEAVINAISGKNVTSCITHLCSSLRSEIDDISYFISKAKCYYMKLKFVSSKDSEECSKTIIKLENLICAQMIYIVRVINILLNGKIPLGSSWDTLIRLLMQLYVNLADLTKHLNLRNTAKTVDSSSIGFDKLVKSCGKSFAMRIYSLITYIRTVSEPDGDKTGSKARDKINKNTRHISSLVMKMENFNKFIFMFDKKTGSKLATKLHSGTVRDFKINIKTLKETCDVEPSDREDDDKIDDGSSTAITSESSQLLHITDDNQNLSVRERLDRNVKKVNKRASKRIAAKPEPPKGPTKRRKLK